MASSSDTEAAASDQFSELSSVFQRLLMRRDVSLFLPFILGFTTTAEGDDNNNNNNNNNNPNNNNNNNNNNSPQEPSSGQEETSQSRTETNHQQERIILINPFTQGMVVIEGGAQSLESLLSRDLATSTSSSNNGQPPASKASIEAMPTVEIGCEDKDGECVICLEEWELGGVVKVMPCKHRFHPICIEKWLGIHGSCPVCRYKMPVDEQEFGMKREEGERMRRRLGREIWVSFSFNGSNNRRNSDSSQNPAVDSNDVSASSSSSSLGSDHQMEG